jgi:hypothetical protein
VYETKATQNKKERDTHQSRLPPGAVFVESSADQKKKKTKPDKVEKTKLDMESIESQMEKVKINNKLIEEKSKPMTDEDLQKKRARKLKKTLRQIRDLEDKIKADKNVNLEKEQWDKISRKDAIIAEILSLGEELDDDDE